MPFKMVCDSSAKQILLPLQSAGLVLDSSMLFSHMFLQDGRVGMDDYPLPQVNTITAERSCGQQIPNLEDRWASGDGFGQEAPRMLEARNWYQIQWDMLHVSVSVEYHENLHIQVLVWKPHAKPSGSEPCILG